MQHKRDFEELFKEKYEGTIKKAHISKSNKLRHKVLNQEKLDEENFIDKNN